MRINVIPVRFLTDQHLKAEYREIKMLPKAFLRSMKSKNGLGVIGGNYTLNKGHGKALYNKFAFIERRFKQLTTEMQLRNYQTNHPLDLSQIPIEYFGDYTPTSEAIKVNLDRILLRISDKPQWYRWYGESKNWEVFYKTLI